MRSGITKKNEAHEAQKRTIENRRFCAFSCAVKIHPLVISSYISETYMNVADRAAEDASGLLDRAFQTVKLLNLDVEQPDHLGSSREWRVLERKQVRISWLLPIGKKQIEILTFNFRDLYFGDSIPGEFQMITFCQRCRIPSFKIKRSQRGAS